MNKIVLTRTEYAQAITDAIKSMKQSAHEAGERVKIECVIDEARRLVATFYERGDR